MKPPMERGDFSCHAVSNAGAQHNGTDRRRCSIIGLVMGRLAAVKAGASLLVILGIALIVIGLAIVNWSRK